MLHTKSIAACGVPIGRLELYLPIAIHTSTASNAVLVWDTPSTHSLRFSTKFTPCSSYSCLLAHIGMNDEKLDMIDPPSQADHF